MRKWLTASIAVGAMLTFVAGSALAGDTKMADATLRLTSGSVAVGIGWSWGKGTLSYKGKTYKFKVEGISVGEVGVTKAYAIGKVYNLAKLSDFDGVYAAAAAGATAGQGVGATALVNANGVSVTLTSETKGASLKVAAEGVKLKLQK